jgi:hypothetical protein
MKRPSRKADLAPAYPGAPPPVTGFGALSALILTVFQRYGVFTQLWRYLWIPVRRIV